jgi:hypothetical protein
MGSFIWERSFTTLAASNAVIASRGYYLSGFERGYCFPRLASTQLVQAISHMRINNGVGFWDLLHNAQGFINRISRENEIAHVDSTLGEKATSQNAR